MGKASPRVLILRAKDRARASLCVLSPSSSGEVKFGLGWQKIDRNRPKSTKDGRISSESEIFAVKMGKIFNRNSVKLLLFCLFLL